MNMRLRSPQQESDLPKLRSDAPSAVTKVVRPAEPQALKTPIRMSRSLLPVATTSSNA